MIVLLRRWPVVAVGLFISVVLAGWVFVRAAPVYQSTAQVLLLPPSVLVPLPNGEQEVRSNPYLELNYSVAATAEVMATVVGADEVRSRLRASGAAGDYVIAQGSPGSAVMLIDARSESPTMATATATAVLTELQQQLQDRQAMSGAAPSRFVTVSVVEAPTPAQQQLGSRIRMAGAVLLLGIVATVLTAFALEALGRRGSRTEDAVPSEVESQHA